MFSVKCSNLDSILPPAKTGDVGFDLIASSDPKIVGQQIQEGSSFYETIDYIEYDIDLQIEVPEGYYCLVFPRSSISNYNLQLCNSVGVIDNGFRGNLKARFNYVLQPNLLEQTKYFRDGWIYENFVTEVNLDKIYKKGDKIAQIVFQKYLIPELVQGELSVTDRADGGFGSTGR